MEGLWSAIAPSKDAEWFVKDPNEAMTPNQAKFDGHALFNTAWENAVDRDLLKLMAAEAMRGLEEAAAKGKFETTVTFPNREEVDLHVYKVELTKMFEGRDVHVETARVYSSTSRSLRQAMCFKLLQHDSEHEPASASQTDVEEVN